MGTKVRRFKKQCILKKEQHKEHVACGLSAAKNLRKLSEEKSPIQTTD
jgi:hypothetical protein